MKTILVIDVPDNINKPAIEYRIYSTEPFRKTRITGYRHLDPMPNQLSYDIPKELEDFKVSKMLGIAYVGGWNACLEEIEKC